LAAVKAFIVGSPGLIGWPAGAILIAFRSIDCAADAFLPLLISIAGAWLWPLRSVQRSSRLGASF